MKDLDDHSDSILLYKCRYISDTQRIVQANQLSATVLFTSSKFACASGFLQKSKYYYKWGRLSLQRIMESIIEFSKQITAKSIVKIMNDRWTYQF